jgi:hypothetical protein|tara:strand:+ start:154 stop:489 length:336 start_codon:yes stop_codon:yes gene_type:complete
MNEQNLQEAVITYIKLKYKGIRYCASAGGLVTTIQSAAAMKRAGYVKGVPDLQIMESRHNYHSLFIELKTKKGRLSPHQKQWIDDLNNKGYFAKCCYGLDECIDLIDWYLK